VAQLGARLNGIQEVTGSIPVRSTILRSRELTPKRELRLGEQPLARHFSIGLTSGAHARLAIHTLKVTLAGRPADAYASSRNFAMALHTPRPMPFEPSSAGMA
jgi:hypothetical protein